MCDIDKEVCRRPKSNFCRNCIILVLAGILGFVLAFKGANLGALFAPRNDTKAKENETESPEIMPYMAGVGVSDMTGPVVQIAFMGHADMNQRGIGIHTRQWARAFIIDNNTTRVVIVSAEIHVVGIALRREVVRNLQKIYSEEVYNLTNVIIAATHTYSTPGGFLGDYLLDVSVLGFSNEVFYAYCNGITKAIVRAHNSVQPARLFYAQTRVWNAHINRSPKPYQKNPKIERARYDMDTDNHLSQIRIMKRDNVLMGVMTFFAINANNLPVTNLLVSSDNLGFAALAMERALNPGMTLHGTGKVIGAFFVGNAGDVSPNIRGGRCKETKKPCDNRHQGCPQNKDYCVPLGPAEEPRDSAKIIGSAIFEAAMRVLVSPEAVEMSEGEEPGVMSVAYQYIQPATETAPKYIPANRAVNKSHEVKGCVPAFGHAYSVGGLDGRPQLTLKDNYFAGNDLLDAIRSGSLMNLHTLDDQKCHAPKTIWVATGRADFPVPWHQTSSVIVMNFGGRGGMYLASVPGEPSTMAGRRIRQVIKTATGADVDRIVLMGLTNEYIHHIATVDEYEYQAMEGGATIYGPNTLDLYLKKYTELAKIALKPNGKVEDLGPEPSYFKDQAVSLVIPAQYDNNWKYLVEQWMAANPRNELFHDMTHMTIDRFDKDSENWHVILSDADWDTRMEWSQDEFTNEVTLYWDIPASARYSYYRFHYYGAAKTVSTGQLHYFDGTTRTFYVSYKYTHK